MDTYSKIVLTVIGIALCAIAAKLIYPPLGLTADFTADRDQVKLSIRRLICKVPDKHANTQATVVRVWPPK